MRPVIQILLADDEADVLEDLHDMLVYQKTLLYELQIVAMATDGEEAVQMAAEFQPDLAILDLQMPGMDGVVAAKAMLKQFPAPKVIIYSAHHDRINLLDALGANIRGYVLKSRSSALLSALEEVIQGGVSFDPQVFNEMYGNSLKENPAAWLSTLTGREKEVLELFHRGKSQSRISKELQIAPDTVKSHLANIRLKAGCDNLVELKMKLLRLGPIKIQNETPVA